MTEFIDPNDLPTLQEEDLIALQEELLSKNRENENENTDNVRDLSSVLMANELEQFLHKYSQGLPLHELQKATSYIDFIISSFSLQDPLSEAYYSSFLYVVSLPLLERKSNERLLKESFFNLNKFLTKLLLLWTILPPHLLSSFLAFLYQFINPLDLNLPPDVYLEEDIVDEKKDDEKDLEDILNEEGEEDEEIKRKKRLSKYKKTEKKTKKTVKYWRILDNNYIIKILYNNQNFLNIFNNKISSLIFELKYIKSENQDEMNEEIRAENERREEEERQKEREDLTLYGLPPSYIATLKPSESYSPTSTRSASESATQSNSNTLTTTIINENLKLMISFLLYFTSFSNYAYKFFANNFVSSLFTLLDKEFEYNPRGNRISYIVEIIWNILESFIEFSNEELKKQKLRESEKKKEIENIEDEIEEEEYKENKEKNEKIDSNDEDYDENNDEDHKFSTLFYPPPPPSTNINFTNTIYSSALKLIPYKKSSLKFFIYNFLKKRNSLFSLKYSLEVIGRIFSYYLFYGYKYNDKELRNELLIILIYLSEFPHALSSFISTPLSFSTSSSAGFSTSPSSSTSNLFEYILTYSYVEEIHGPFYEKHNNNQEDSLSPSSPSSPSSPTSPSTSNSKSTFPGIFLPFYSLPIAYSRNFSTINDVDLEFKKKIWYILSNLLKEEAEMNKKIENDDEKLESNKFINNSSLFLSIFKYLEYNSSSSSTLMKKHKEITNQSNNQLNWKMKSTSLEQQKHAQTVLSSILPFHLTLKKKREEDLLKEKEEMEKFKQNYDNLKTNKSGIVKPPSNTTKKLNFDNTFSSSSSILYQSKKKGFIESLTPSRLREFQVQASLFLLRNGKDFLPYFIENNLIISLLNLILNYFNYIYLPSTSSASISSTSSTSAAAFPEHEQILAHLLTFLLEIISKKKEVLSYYLLFSIYNDEEETFSLFFNQDFSSFYDFIVQNSNSNSSTSLTFFQHLLFFFNKLSSNDTIRALLLRVITLSYSSLANLNQFNAQQVLNQLQNPSLDEEFYIDNNNEQDTENFYPFLSIFEVQISSYNNIENLLKILNQFIEKLPVQVGLKAGIKINKNIDELSEKENKSDSISSLSSSFSLFSPSFSLPSLLISPYNNEVNLLIISFLDFIHYLIVQNKNLLHLFLYSNGVDMLFNLLENSSYLLRIKLLRILSDLYSSPLIPISTLLPYALNWRSNKTLRTLPQILCHIWLDEEIKQLETSEGGIHFIGNLSNNIDNNSSNSSVPLSHRVSGVISNLFHPFEQQNWPQEPKEEALIGSSPNFGGRGETVGPGGIIKNKNLIKKSTTFSFNTVLFNPSKEDDLIKASITSNNPSSMMVSRLSSAILASRFLNQSNIPSHLSSKIVEIDSRGLLSHLFFLLNLYNRYNINDETNPFKLYEVLDEKNEDDEENNIKGEIKKEQSEYQEIFGDISLTTREKQVLILGKKYLSLRESEWWQKLMNNLNEVSKYKYEKNSQKKEEILNERLLKYQDVQQYYNENYLNPTQDIKNDPYYQPKFDHKDEKQIEKENSLFYINPFSYLKSDIVLISQRLENSFDASLSSLIEQKLFNYLSIKDQNVQESLFIEKILVKKSQQIKAAWLKRNARLNPPTKRQWNNTKTEEKKEEEKIEE